MAGENKLSPVELIKSESQHLRGTIGEDLASDSDQFAKPNTQLLKFHGTYQQDDRDSRAKKDGKSGKQFSMMTRTRIPGGRLTAAQLLAHLDLCDTLGNATLKCTTRQALQLHGIVKSDLRETIRRINEVQLSTLAACGDVNRNVMCCPAPLQNAVHSEMHRLTEALKDHLAPRTRAYYELWLQDDQTGEKTLVGGGAPESRRMTSRFTVQPTCLANSRLPLPYRMTIASTSTPMTWVFLAVVRDEKIVGYNVPVGGGLGTTPSAKKPFRRSPNAWPLSRPNRRWALPRRLSKSSATTAIARIARSRV